MLFNLNILNPFNFPFCSELDKNSTSIILNNPKNVLFVSLDVKILESISTLIKKYSFQRNISMNFYFLGILKDDAQQFTLINEILSESKCKIFILQKELSDLNFILQATDIANITSNIQIIHNSLSYCSDIISNFSARSMEQVLNIGISATQQHLSAGASIPNQYFDSYRLGSLLNQIETLSMPIAFSNILVADVSALKQSDITGRKTTYSSGLTTQEFNQIARSAGFNGTQITILTGLNDVIEDEISTDTLAQFIYYFVDGVISYSQLWVTPHLTEFTINECLPYEHISFYKDDNNNRWYAQYPTTLPNHLKNYQNVPCMYEDYAFSSKGELSPRLMSIFNAIDALVN